MNRDVKYYVEDTSQPNIDMACHNCLFWMDDHVGQAVAECGFRAPRWMSQEHDERTRLTDWNDGCSLWKRRVEVQP